MRKLFCIAFFGLIGILGFAQSFSPEEQLQLDSIIGVINDKSLADTTRIDARVEFGERTMLLRVGYWDSIANDCSALIKTTSKKQINKKLQAIFAHSLNNIGYISKQTGDVDNAIKYYNKSLEIHKIINDSIGIATGLNNLGIIYNSFGEIAKALDCYHKSLKDKRKNGRQKRCCELS
jgi:tetratricopeptide (TPR) repeat protein